MTNFLTQWLAQYGIAEQYLHITSQVLGFAMIIGISAISYYLTKHQMLRMLKKLVTASTNTWDDLLLQYHVFSRIALLLPLLLLLALTPYFFTVSDNLANMVSLLAKIALCFQVAQVISAALNVVQHIAASSSAKRYLPINATIQIIKLMIYLVASILSIALLVDRSPLYLLSGLGALTAVLLLIFQDTIKGFVASIQISVNKMVAPGDWIEMPKYGADGDVIEIALNTVKVRNFDNTITTVPTYALINESFKNWRGMLNSNGRRIKRAILFNVSSVHFCTTEQLQQFKSVKLLTNYINEKQQLINDYHNQHGIDGNDLPNARQLTNLGTFRAYIEAYLAQHENVQHDMTCMVRQLPVTAEGVPLELYFFSNDKVWVNYERIQADIFDHLIAMAPHFNLSIFQHPTGQDFNKLKISIDKTINVA